MDDRHANTATRGGPQARLNEGLRPARIGRARKRRSILYGQPARLGGGAAWWLASRLRVVAVDDFLFDPPAVGHVDLLRLRPLPDPLVNSPSERAACCLRPV